MSWNLELTRCTNIKIYSQDFFFVPPRAPCRAFKNHIMKSTASPVQHKTAHICIPHAVCFAVSKYEEALTFTLLGDLEVFLAAQHHGLQHLMRRHVGLEVSRIPKLTHQLPKPLHQQKHDVARRPADPPVVFLFQEVVPQGRDIGEGLRKQWK